MATCAMDCLDNHSVPDPVVPCFEIASSPIRTRASQRCHTRYHFAPRVRTARWRPGYKIIDGDWMGLADSWGLRSRILFQVLLLRAHRGSIGYHLRVVVAD